MAIPCCQNAKILSTSIFEFTFQRFELNRSLVNTLGRYQSVICCLMSICICCLFSVYIWLQMFVPACVNRGLAPAGAAGCYKYKSGQKYKTWTMELELQSGSSVDPKSIALNCRRGLLAAQREFYSFVTTLILTRYILLLSCKSQQHQLQHLKINNNQYIH